MTTPTQAPPAAVEQLSELPEFELRPDGTVQPLTAQNQVDTSAPASQNGAGGESVGSPAEPTVQTAPTQQPVQPPVAPAASSQPVQPEAQQPVVQVVQPTQPVPAETQAQPEATPAPATKEPAPEELAAAESRLDDSLEQERQRIREEVTRATQSAFDKRAAQLDRQVQEARQREQEYRQQIRELQTRDLTDEERATVMAKFAQEDERAELDAARTELLDFHRSLMVQSLLIEFASYGVAQESIEQLESPQEMEAYCLEQKADFLENQMNEARQQASQPAPAAQVQAAPQAAQPAQPVEQPQPNVPAGATAPIDIGGGGVLQTGSQFNTEASPEAMKENLKNMGWSTVRINR